MSPDPGEPGQRIAGRPGAIAAIAALATERRTLTGHAVSGRGIEVIQSGPGSAAAGDAAARAVRSGAMALVSWGVAGGIAPDAVTGVVCLPRRVLREGRPAIEVDSRWRARVMTELAGRFELLEGEVVDAGEPVTTPGAKAALAARFPAAAVVDMESYAIAATAAQQDIPLLVVRAVVDGPADALLQDVATLVTARGGVSVPRVVRALFRRPSSLREFRELGRRSAKAHAALRGIAACLGGSRFAFDPAERISA